MTWRIFMFVRFLQEYTKYGEEDKIHDTRPEQKGSWTPKTRFEILSATKKRLDAAKPLKIITEELKEKKEKGQIEHGIPVRK